MEDVLYLFWKRTREDMNIPGDKLYGYTTSRKLGLRVFNPPVVVQLLRVGKITSKDKNVEEELMQLRKDFPYKEIKHYKLRASEDEETVFDMVTTMETINSIKELNDQLVYTEVEERK